MHIDLKTLVTNICMNYNLTCDVLTKEWSEKVLIWSNLY